MGAPRLSTRAFSGFPLERVFCISIQALIKKLLYSPSLTGDAQVVQLFSASGWNAHLETKWVHCCQAGAFHLILLSLQSDCHPLVNTWCCHQHWYHYSYAWEGDAFTLAAGSPSVRHFHFIINQTTNGVAFSSFLVSVRWGTSLSLYS